MQYYYIRNWKKFQHYKHRNPPWIKLHSEIFSSPDWVTLSDANKLLMVVCMVVAARHSGRVPASSIYLRRIACLSHSPNLKPLIECGFLSETLADASLSVQMLLQSPETEKKDIKVNGFKNGEAGHSVKKKAKHGSKTRDGKRIWFDFGTDEWKQYAEDYRDAHSGVGPKTEWDGAGSWFNLMGEPRAAAKSISGA